MSDQRRRPGYLGLGANLGDRRAALSHAVAGLESGGVRVDRVSPLYETDPVGVYEAEQPRFLNGVAEIARWPEPLELLGLCKRLEQELGRDLAGPRHGPRPLDIDILLLGDLELSTAELTVPHPSLTERGFVLRPLLDLDPDLTLPDGTPLAPLLEAVGEGGLDPAGELGPG